MRRRLSIVAKQERDKGIIKMREAGWTQKIIAESFGTSTETVRSVLSKVGMTGHGRGQGKRFHIGRRY